MHAVQRLLLAALLVLAPAPGWAQEAPAQAAAEEAPRATVTSFEGEDALNNLAAQGTTVVFFYAAWCPNCRATISELNARWAEVNPDLTVVIADYDKESTLKAKFGVTYQDTFVLLDAQGNAVKSWNAGGVDGLNANSAG
jgi:thiol-disulfide isomerase/thioredoxin